MKPIVLYHGNCADGFGAAWAIWKAKGDEYEYFPAAHGDQPPTTVGRDVVMVDFCYKRPVIEVMLRQASSVTILDHHESAMEDLAGLAEQYPRSKAEIIFDMTRSGAMMAWQHFHPGVQPPMLLEHIQDRDLWLFSIPGTRDVQAALFSYPYDFATWDRLMACDPLELMRDGEAIERKHHKDVAELVAVTKRPMVICGHLIMACSLPYTLASDAGHLLAGECMFGVCYWDTADRRVFSLRSREGGVNVADIAVQYGGGGHKHAAGFRVPRDHWLACA